MVSSGDGSPTSTCWKRRSRAASFSMCWRYSSSVVAPTIRSSPRASIGLIMLPASIAPSPVAPAPTMVCSSSMKVTTSPAESVISLSTAFSRSSNSPRNFAPATIDPRSRAMTRLPRSDSGTSPAMMRWARPSTIAVLPTPGSPIRTGLFFVRRDSTCTTRRISVSRPMTGSSSPARARAVRSTPYFSSALNVLSGSALVIRAEPRTLANASRSASGVAPWRLSRSATWPPSVASPTSRCSVETYSSPSSVASFWACVSDLTAKVSNCGLDTVAPVADGSAAMIGSSSLCTTPGSAPTAVSSGAVSPSPCASRAPSRWAADTCGLPAMVAACAADEIACWVFVVGLKASIPHLMLDTSKVVVTGLTET